MLPDQTKEPGPATPETLAIMGSLGRLLRLRIGALFDCYGIPAS